MNRTDKQRIINRYNERLLKFGPTIEALASGVEDRRQLRFKVLEDVGISKGDRILDLGCGFGDLYIYLEKMLGVGNFVYTGVDINPNLIAVASERVPSGTFITRDILSEPLSEEFDYVVSTSSFNLQLESEDNYDFMKSVMQCCYSIAKKGVAIDFLTSYVDFKESNEAFYYEPEKLFSIAKSITRRVTLRHDYPLFDFCLYLYPDFTNWKSK